MKRMTILAAIVAATLTASAQYYQLANQATNMISAAVQGGPNYRGMVDVSYINGVGSKQANLLEFSTTQGFKYTDWFYMGVGAGVDVMFTEVNDNYYHPASISGNTTQTSAMIPLYTDFRFNWGNQTRSAFFLDLRIGAAFYINDSYILVGDGYINSGQSFYLKPAVGVRIPVSKPDSKHAVNITCSYQLLTNTYWYNPGRSNGISLNGIGFSAGYEW